MRLNLRTGQQCVRDFFLCVHENVVNWPDLYKIFCFSTVTSTMCLACKHRNESEQSQIYLEMEVPPNGSELSDYQEEMINESSRVQYHCQDGCQAHFQAETRSLLKSVRQAEFLIVLLRRSIMTENGIEIVENSIGSVKNISLRLVNPLPLNHFL
jgi:hypothetical protein